MSSTLLLALIVTMIDWAIALLLTRKLWSPDRRHELASPGSATKFFLILHGYLFIVPILLFIGFWFLEIGLAILGFEIDSGEGIDLLIIVGLPYLILIGTLVLSVCWLAILGVHKIR